MNDYNEGADPTSRPDEDSGYEKQSKPVEPVQETFEFQCGSCGATVVAEVGWRGCAFECPSCGKEMEVPTKAAALKGVVAQRTTRPAARSDGGKRIRKPRIWIIGLLALFGCLGGILLMGSLGGGRASHGYNSERMTQTEEEEMYRKAMSTLPNKHYVCEVCGGSGQVANTTVRPRTGLTGSSEGQCETCHGNGSIRTPSGYDAVCPTCAGLGGRRTTPCRNCQGSGYVVGW